MNELSKTKNSNLTLTQRMTIKKSQPVLLLDVSGSMNEEVEPGRRKIDALQDVVKNSFSGNIYAFNTTCNKVSKNQIPSPYGGTCMSQAIKACKSSGYRKIVMITDGNCDSWDEQLTIEECKNIELQILYIGFGEKPDFLNRLAKSTNGFCTKEDIRETKEISDKLTLLLEGPKGDNTICL